MLKPKDDRTYGERVDDRLEAGYRNKRFRKNAVKMVEAGTTWGRYHQGNEENTKSRR